MRWEVGETKGEKCVVTKALQWQEIPVIPIPEAVGGKMLLRVKELILLVISFCFLISC